MILKRSSGVLMHPTSLPGRFGIGDLGQAAYRFVDFLEQSGQTLWQVMPLCPTGYGDSPYQGFSAFAGNPYLINLDQLVEDGWLSEGSLSDVPDFPVDRVDYGPVIEYKMDMLKSAYHNFKEKADGKAHEAILQFKKENAFWIEDFTLFMALKDAHEGESWRKWGKEITLSHARAKKKWRKKLADTIQAHTFYQHLFFEQWKALRKYANNKKIKIVGDIPIFVAYDSADVWANRNLFYLDRSGCPTAVAGVPPDYFSETGQLWGNPLYRWKKKDADYQWWIERIRISLRLFDVIRLDHFRGFEAYWEVPADEETAINGKWVKGPGADLFHALINEFGSELPIIAEDLGVITEPVRKLRDQFQFPGMKILQFAFGDGATCTDLPHNYSTRGCVVYTGTHDNDTTRGWYEKTATEEERDYVRRYLGVDGHDICWDLIRLAFMSIANAAIVTIQDLLNLGGEARMNLPGNSGGNWSWRFKEGDINEFISSRLKELSETYGRNIKPKIKSELVV
ncbi:MAG: 4-alpha-glucanotransferase [Candidatus Cloacimonetes bacterium 4572_55]|nr:MAG: 4-alpha-glucanotransferase [Candidatus Cloacimonetes bacterium 4572_55]